MNEIDLNKPIFVLYLCISGLSPQRADEQMVSIKKYLAYDNINLWVIPVNHHDSKVELIWAGKEYSEDPGMVKQKNLIEQMNSIVDIISDGTSDDIIIKNLRDLKIKSVLNGG